MFTRYVALGDSQTEGLLDGDEQTGYRGWADRLATHLATVDPSTRYANLAVRGQLAGQVLATQLAPALALRPDLATVVAGVNDLLRRRYDGAAVAGHLEAMFAALTDTGATVLTVVFPDPALLMPLGRALTRRVADLNTRIRAAAARHEVAVVDMTPYPVCVDPRLWSPDRLHLSALGHTRFAAAAAHTLGLPGSSLDWTHALTPLTRPTPWQRLRTEAQWATDFAGPWLARRLRRHSTGHNRTAKRPDLLPV